jgi:DICT domain-containing protein
MNNNNLPHAAGAALPPANCSAGALVYRVKALFHNCMSAAAFAREDALRAQSENDEQEATCKRREAIAYEQVASWLSNVPKQ